MTFVRRAGGRKFIATVMSIASADILAWFHHIDPGVYSVIMVATVGAFIAGNVTQKAVVAAEMEQ